MREIKFRAIIDDPAGLWVYGDLIYDSEENPRILTNRKEMLFSTCLKGTEGQFTGLKDKNGKEIYEGDIVKYEDKEEPEDNYIDELIYENSGYTTKQNGLWSSFPEGYEVIGNTYENPELLNDLKGDLDA